MVVSFSKLACIGKAESFKDIQTEVGQHLASDAVVDAQRLLVDRVTQLFLFACITVDLDEFDVLLLHAERLHFLEITFLFEHIFH